MGRRTVLVDNDGMVHIAFGFHLGLDDDLTDAGWTFFPSTMRSTQYWNESFGADSLMTIPMWILNGNGHWKSGGIDNYENSYGSYRLAPPPGCRSMAAFHFLHHGKRFLNAGR